jgi:excisionase family DNA binding protein
MSLLSVKDAASRLGVSAGLIYSLVAGRKLRFVRVGNGRGRIRIPEDAIDEYLSRVTFAPQEPKVPAVRVKLKHLSLD